MIPIFRNQNKLAVRHAVAVRAGQAVEVKVQPATIPLWGGKRPTVFIAAQVFQDFGGVTENGARIAREPVSEQPCRGFSEKRPSYISVKITSMVGTYAGAQELMAVIAPTVDKVSAAAGATKAIKSKTRRKSAPAAPR